MRDDVTVGPGASRGPQAALSERRIVPSALLRDLLHELAYPAATFSYVSLTFTA